MEIFGINPAWSGIILVLGLGIGYTLRIWLISVKRGSLEKQTQEELVKAREEAKDLIFEAKDKAASVLSDLQEEERERKKELRQREERLQNKEDSLEQERKEVRAQEASFKTQLQELADGKEELSAKRQRVIGELERVAGLDKDKAKLELISNLEKEYQEELAEKLLELEREKRDKLEKRGLEVITSSIQRYARDYVSDITTTTVPIPDEDLKGKIIGREGRNIRTFEKLTGVEVIVDEAPESITLSSFDPLRRELARIAMEKLIKDGRIQPAKIEEKVEEARVELDETIRKAGEEATYDAGVLDLPDEIVKVLGRLKYRTSYGQNVLDHSVEMTHIAGMIASELGLDVDITKKAALVHDIGKAIDHDVEGTHVELGRKLLKKYGVDDRAIKGMEAHHDEFPFSTPESYVVAAADAISAARPGARRDTLEKYLKRVEEIEQVAGEFEGVDKVYAVSAGREVRVFVIPEKIDDFGALNIAKKIANKIKSTVQYPGEVKVTVIREVKAVEYAR